MLTYIQDTRGEIEPTVLAGLIYRQSVVIHPFTDGNGLTTRLLTTAIFGISGLDLFEIFSFQEILQSKYHPLLQGGRLFEAKGIGRGTYYVKTS
jgi:Fic family protein